jgi:hypothetical protein
VSLLPVLGRGELGTSLLYVFPLFLIYEVGVMFAPAINGVDFVTRNLYHLVGYSRRNYLLLHGALALVFFGVVLWSRRQHRGSGRFLPMFLESGIYALTLGSFIVFVMQNVLGLSPRLSLAGLGTAAQGVVLSLGAGVHEELVFRLGLFSGGAALLCLFGMRPRLGILLACIASAALFSAAHHVGTSGDAWSVGVFVYRWIAGLVFTAIYYYRSLAHACYAHALYDVYVLLLK